jgi:hypothetical protein
MADVILKVLAEGGSIALCRTASKEGWFFSLESDESALLKSTDEDGVKISQVVGSWDEALRLLDQYRWTIFWPEVSVAGKRV